MKLIKATSMSLNCSSVIRLLQECAFSFEWENKEITLNRDFCIGQIFGDNPIKNFCLQISKLI